MRVFQNSIMLCLTLGKIRLKIGSKMIFEVLFTPFQK